MANFQEVNKAVKSKYPNLDIEVVRGEGYIYFSGDDAFDKVQPIMAHPVSTSTEDVIRLVLDELEEAL